METSEQKSTTLNLWFKIFVYATAFYIFDNLLNKFILS